MLKVALLFQSILEEKDYEYIYSQFNKEKYNVSLLSVYPSKNTYTVDLYNVNKKTKISDAIKYLKTFDIIFPISSSKTIYTLLDKYNINYIGSNLFINNIFLIKQTFDRALINQLRYECVKISNKTIIYIDKNLNETNIDNHNLALILENTLGFPIYIKPSLTISKKVNSIEELKKEISLVIDINERIIFEKSIAGELLEVVVTEIKDIIISPVFNNNIIFDDLDETIYNKLKKIAIKTFNILDKPNLLKLSFFLKDNKLYINQISTIFDYNDVYMYETLGINIDNLITEYMKKTSYYD